MVSLLPVRGGVLDAPRSCDRRGGVGADGRRDRWHPRYPRHTRLRSPLHVSYPAGTARAPLARRAGSTSSVIRRKGRRGRRPLRVVRAGRCQHKTAVARPPGCVRRNRWAWPIAPAFPTVRTVTSASTRIRSRGHSPRTILYGRTHVIHRPTPGGRGSPPLQGIRIAPTLPATPQSRRFAPRQLPFQGSRDRFPPVWMPLVWLCVFDAEAGWGYNTVTR